jgi:hypothetical protein
LAQVWEPVADRLRSAVDETTWELWLAALHLHAATPGELHVACPPAAVEWTHASFGRVLTAAAGPRLVVVEACLGPPGRSSHATGWPGTTTTGRGGGGV